MASLTLALQEHRRLECTSPRPIVRDLGVGWGGVGATRLCLMRGWGPQQHAARSSPHHACVVDRPTDRPTNRPTDGRGGPSQAKPPTAG